LVVLPPTLTCMKVLTFSWEFPPAKNGGLGVACHGLIRELLDDGVDVVMVLPKTQETTTEAKFVFADTERLSRLGDGRTMYFGPYCQSDTNVYSIIGYDATGKPLMRGRTILEEAHRFAHQASTIANIESHDVIHAHDWTSYLAGVAAKVAGGKQLIVHVHATSFDQAGGDNVDPGIFQIEQHAFMHADKIVTVSDFTRNIVIEKHGADPEKVEVVHNGCDTEDPVSQPAALCELKKRGKKIVL